VTNQGRSRKKILFVVTRRIGDSIAITPAIRAAYKHYPSANIIVICKKGLSDIFLNNRFISNVIEISTPRAKLKYFFSMKNRFDVCFAYTENRSFLKLANRIAKITYNYYPNNEKNLITGVQYIEQPDKKSREHIILENLALLSLEGIQHNGYRMDFELMQQEQDNVNIKLSQLKQKDSLLVCLKIKSHPQKNFRDWSIARFSELIDLLIGAAPGIKFAIVGAKQESESIDDLCNRHPFCTKAFYGQSLRETAAIVFASDLYIGVDTGVTQIASCGSVPMIGLYHCLITKERAGPLEHPSDFSINMSVPTSGCSRSYGSMDVILAKDILRIVEQAVKLN